MSNWRARGSEPMNEEAGAPEVRMVLRDMEARRAEPSPFFAKRVMAAIETQEVELSRRSRAWAAVPVFASRLSAIAALLLVMAGTWLYTGSHRQPATTSALVEDIASNAQPSNQDEVFVSPAEDTQ
jgi:hypothetical protein